MSSAETKSRGVVGVDLVRFAAAFCVMTFHLAYWSWAQADSTTAQVVRGLVSFPDLAPYTWWGWVGVQIFFVISGFVIASSAQDKTALQFAIGRFLRLYPAVWICATITFAVLIANHLYAHPGGLIRSLVLWPVGDWVDGVYWTLGVEMVFYGAVFVMLLLNLRIERLFWVMGVGGILAIVPWLSGWEGSYNRVGKLFLQYGCYFALGGFIWLATTRHLKRAELGFCLALAAAGCFEVANAGAAYSRATQVPVVAFLAGVTLIVGAVRYNASMPISARITRVAGLTTYPLYLLHDVVGAALMVALVRTGLAPLVALIVSMVAMIAVSIAIALFVEPVVTSRLRSIMQKLPSLFGAA